MHAIAITDPGRLVCLSVMRLCCTNTAEWFEVVLGVETLEDLRNIVLGGGPDIQHGFDAAFAQLHWPLFFIYHADMRLHETRNIVLNQFLLSILALCIASH